MSLSTLIVQREIASIREVEEALARQVLYGGDLVTNLLEVCRLDEAQLLPLVAESLGLPPAPPGELPRPDPEAQRLVAAEVASLRNLAPLTVDRYGLTVAVAEPLSADVEQELSFALALPISQKVAPLVRIKQALARDYGIPLDRRLQRLLRRMMTEGPRASSSFPPMRNADMRMGAPRPPSAAPVAPQSKAATLHRPSVPPGGGPRTLMRQTEMPAPRPLRRRRGAITIEAAHAELDEANERDAIFDLLFEFARQYFDYTAVFVLHGEIAEGRDSFGDGASRDKVVRLGVPLDLPSILSAAREKKGMIQRVPAADGLDAVLMADLGRSGKTICAVLPVVVRTRVVAFLLGDGGDSGIDAAALADVEGIVKQATAAFERVIVRRKLKGSVPAGLRDSRGPEARQSVAPPTQLSGISARPAVEELAPPIRDLMTEPVSLPGETMREPMVRAFVPVEPVVSAALRARADKPPPPPNVLAVRRVSGRPIPREEPESNDRLPAVTAPSNLGPAARAAIDTSTAPISRHTPEGGIPRNRGTRRGEAPKLEFDAVPAASSMFGSGEFSNDEVERKLLAEIQTGSVTSPRAFDSGAPVTARDEHPPVVSPASAPLDDAEPPQSPKAESPPPQRVAPITDVSPTAIDGPPSSTEMVAAEDADVSLDYDATPAAPPVFDESAPLRPPPVPASSQRVMPASEQQVSVAPHRPPTSRSDYSRVLPSVIVDVASEYVGMVERVIAAGSRPPPPGAPGTDDAEAELLRAGGYAMPAIMARFPGPVTIEPDRLAEAVLPRVADCGPVLRLVASQRRTALPFVLSHVEDPDVERRFWATYLLTELVYPDVLEPILQRLFDPEARVRRAARAAGRAFSDAHPTTIVERLALVATDSKEKHEPRMLAIEALGDTRDPAAVPALIPLLDDPDAELAAATRSALTVVTRQDFGPSSQKWGAWWAANHERHRLEWLIDALMHDHAALRASAGEELKHITKEYFGYYDDLPKRERERAQSRYRDWWNTVGRVRFSRASSSRS